MSFCFCNEIYKYIFEKIDEHKTEACKVRHRDEETAVGYEGKKDHPDTCMCQKPKKDNFEYVFIHIYIMRHTPRALPLLALQMF